MPRRFFQHNTALGMLGVIDVAAAVIVRNPGEFGDCRHSLLRSVEMGSVMSRKVWFDVLGILVILGMCLVLIECASCNL